MELLCASAGGYPRIGDKPEQQKLRRAINRVKKDKAIQSELKAVEDEVVSEVIKEQDDAGLDIVTDGLIRWYDYISHFARKLEGIEIGGLLRIFNTNTLFRQPFVVNEIRREKPLLVDEYRYAREQTSKPVKVVMTGPYSLAAASINKYSGYKNFESLVEKYTDIIAAEMKDLSAENVPVVQLDEPYILDYPDNLSFFSSCVEKISQEKGDTTLMLHSFFGDASICFDGFQELPIDILGIDLTYSPKVIDLIEIDGSEKSLALGLIDGRNTKMDDEKNILNILERIIPKVKNGICHLMPSCSLEYLPRERAREKLVHMVHIKDLFSKGGS